MDNEAKEMVYMAFQLLLSAVVIGCIAIAIMSGKKLINIKQTEELAISVQTDNAKLYNYTNSLLKADDIVDLMLNYCKIYDFIIIGGTNSSPSVIYKKEINNDLKEYKAFELTQDLANAGISTDKFTLSLITTSDECQVLALAFLKEGTILDDDKLEQVVLDNIQLGFDVISVK